MTWRGRKAVAFLAELERGGIPTVLLGYTEETGKVRNDSVLHGIPQLRYIEASRNSLGGVTESASAVV